MIDMKELIKKGVHYGHQKRYWSPDMAPFIWGTSNGIHLINVLKTAQMLERAADFLEGIAAAGKTILLVGTKKAARPIVDELAKELTLPSVVNRWIGGTLTNHRQVRKAVTNLLHYEDILAKADQYQHTKKELNEFQKRVERLQKNVGGIRELGWPIGAVVVVDVRREYVCVKEAHAMGIPVVGIVDTNSSPENVDYVVPANDDSNRSIGILLDYLAEGIKKGLVVAEKRAKEEREKAAAEEKEKVKKLKERKAEKAAEVKPAEKPKVKGKAAATKKAEPEKAPSKTAPAKKVAEKPKAEEAVETKAAKEGSDDKGSKEKPAAQATKKKAEKASEETSTGSE